MKTISILGILVALIPFLGIPNSWKTVIFFTLGIIIFAKAFSIMRHQKGLGEIEKNFNSLGEDVPASTVNKEEVSKDFPLEGAEEDNKEERDSYGDF